MAVVCLKYFFKLCEITSCKQNKHLTSPKVISPSSVLAELLLLYGWRLPARGLGYGGGGVPGGVAVLSHPSCLLKSFMLSEAMSLLDASAGDKTDNDSGLDFVRWCVWFGDCSKNTF